MISLLCPSPWWPDEAFKGAEISLTAPRGAQATSLLGSYAISVGIQVCRCQEWLCAETAKRLGLSKMIERSGNLLHNVTDTKKTAERCQGRRPSHGGMRRKPQNRRDAAPQGSLRQSNDDKRAVRRLTVSIFASRLLLNAHSFSIHSPNFMTNKDGSGQETSPPHHL